MGRSGARLLGQKTSGSYEQEYVRNGEGQASQKDKKDSSKHVGEPSKGGCSRPRDMICRQHEFVMGHHRDPTVRYLAIALLTYRRLRPSSRCSQNSVNTGERIFSLDDFFCEETFKTLGVETPLRRARLYPSLNQLELGSQLANPAK